MRDMYVEYTVNYNKNNNGYVNSSKITVIQYFQCTNHYHLKMIMYYVLYFLRKAHLVS